MSDQPNKFDDAAIRRPAMSEEIGELATALALAQAEIDAVPKTETNPFFKSRYADLASVREAIREPFGNHGLSVVQIPQTIGGEAVVMTVLLHKSGQWIRGSLRLRPTKNDPQGMGSAITYARRYSLMAFTGVAPDDDDGNAASDPEPPKGKAKPQEKPPEQSRVDVLKKKLHQVGAKKKEDADTILQYVQRSTEISLDKVRSDGLANTLIEAVDKRLKEYPKTLHRVSLFWRVCVDGGMDPTSMQDMKFFARFVDGDMNASVEKVTQDDKWSDFFDMLHAGLKQYGDRLFGECERWHQSQKEDLR